MEKAPKGVYTKEFKEEAVKLVMEAELSVPKGARRLSVGTSTIEHWGRKDKKGILPCQDKVTPEDMDLARLRKENAELKGEREFSEKPS